VRGAVVKAALLAVNCHQIVVRVDIVRIGARHCGVTRSGLGHRAAPMQRQTLLEQIGVGRKAHLARA
jgi:hypothetical protein